MSADLRPMNLGEILDRTLQIYRSRFWAFAAIAVIPTAAVDLIYFADEAWIHVHSLIQPGWTKSGLLLWNFVVGLGFFNLFSFLFLIFEPAIILVASGKNLNQNCSLAGAWRFNAISWRGFTWIAILKTAASLIAPEILTASVLFVEAFYFAVLRPQVVSGLGSIIVFLVPAVAGGTVFIWAGACLSLALPVATLEGSKGIGCLKRSWRLSAGTRSRVAIVWMVMYVSMWIAAWGSEVLLGQLMLLVGQTFHIATSMRELYRPAVFVLVSGLYVLTYPIYPIAITLFYYDQRIRREAFDIEWMMQRAGLTAPDLASPEAQPFPDLQQSPQPSPAPLEGSV